MSIVLESVAARISLLTPRSNHCFRKTVLSKFVSWMNGLQIFQIKVHSRYGIDDFNDDLRTVMRRVGVDNEKICFIFDECNALSSAFLEAMNALLASGEVPGLFDGDDYTALMSALRESAARDGVIVDSEDELWRRFTGGKLITASCHRCLYLILLTIIFTAIVSSRPTQSSCGLHNESQWRRVEESINNESCPLQ